MADAIRIKTSRQFNQIPSIVKRIRSNSAQAAYNFARGTAASARRRAPVRTGYLRSSIVNEKIDYGRHKVTVGARYGAYVEYGTRNMAAQPFFRPAVEENKAIFMQQMRQVFHR